MQIFTEMREAYVYDNVSYQEIEGGERSFRKIIESIADTWSVMLPKLLVYR